MKSIETKERTPSSNPLESLLDHLWDLAIVLDPTSTENPSGGMLERYNYFVRYSEHGRSCPYALKSKELFTKLTLPKVKDSLLAIINLIRSIPGNEEFGK
jgi:hypothetical protein